MTIFLKKTLSLSFAIITVIFTFVPESLFEKHQWVSQDFLGHCKFASNLDLPSINVVISRLVCFILTWGLISVVYILHSLLRKKIIIEGSNYAIQIEYGDILKKDNCKRVINFDECFTTKVGNNIEDINPSSICGQYLKTHPNLDIQRLISISNIKPEKSKSKFQQKTRYASGTLIPNEDDLLMAFAKLDEKGKGRFFSRDEYLQCLERLWQEAENYYSGKDVCVPVLGAGTTSFDGGCGASFSKKELLDIMISSYKLSSHKIKAPCKLIIVCGTKSKDFSINNIDK